MIIRRLLAVLVVFVLVVAVRNSSASATNIYITQSGSPSGNCTSNVQTPAFFNSTSNWGSGSSQIGPGTTVLLCGTFTFPANTSGFVVKGSGSSASPITILFDSGAILQSAAFAGFGSPYGGGIVLNGVNYVVVDGKNTGIIQNTANGSPGQKSCLSGSCSVQISSLGVYVHNTTSVTVQNLKIQNIYMDMNGEQNGGESGPAFLSGDIYADGPNTSLKITGNTLKDSHVGAWVSFDNGSTSADIYNNVISHHGWQISAANGSSCSNSATINVYGNDVSNFTDWDAGGAASFHTDGIIEYTRSNGCTAPTFNPMIYNNYFHGSLDDGTGAGTAMIYCSNDQDGSKSFANSTCTAFNNVIDESTGGNTACYAAFWVAGQNAQFYNNTLSGTTCSTGQSYGFVFGNGTKATLKNNILVGFQHNFGDPGPYGDVSTEIASSNYNLFYNCVGGSTCWYFGQGNWSTLSAWSSAVGQDKNSSAGNPQLTGSYMLGSGSAAVGLAVNLDSSMALSPCCSTLSMQQANLGIKALAYDKALQQRPTSASWDAGAYTASTGTVIAPPTGLTVVVQ